MATLISIESLVAGYGWGDILKGASLEVETGKITCIIGPNGAGKSTLLKAISGLLSIREGDIELDGKSIIGLSPRQILLSGIAHVPQDRGLFALMTVRDNLLMGGYTIRDRSLLLKRADEVAEIFPIVKERAHEHAGTLSGGQQRAVEIARSLMLHPKLVLMDELSMGLDPKSRKFAFETVVRVNEAGRTILMVEQNARAGLVISHCGAVMDQGTVRLTGSGPGLLDDPEVSRLYLGGMHNPGLSTRRSS